MKIHLNRETLVNRANQFAVPFTALGSFLLYFVMEMMSRHSFIEAIQYLVQSPLQYLYNTLIIFASLNIAFLFKRRFLVRFLITVMWLLLGMSNCIILANRVTPFTGQDLKLFSDAKKIMNNYLSPFMFGVIVAGLLVVLGLIVFCFIKGPKYSGPRKIVVDIVIVIVSALSVFAGTKIGIQTRVLSSYFGNLASAYQSYGLPYCFLVTVFDTGVSQPNSYSEEMVDYIKETMDDLPKTSRAKKPNVIFLQLESFFDPETVRYLDISEDPIPYFHQLQEEYSSGTIRVPVIGAGTVNTEFEIITGMSLQYFGAGEYPYKTILKKETCESVAYDLRTLGYGTHAIHNNEANFYSRRSVYSRLGFESFTSEEYMPDISDVTETGWVKDHILTDEIMKCLESTDSPDYIYTVSVQGHGDYPTEQVVEDPQIRVTGAETKEKNNNSWEYYVKQLREMDDFIRDLTEALEAYDEPTMLVMYGDHLPTMGLTKSDVYGYDLYRTPYVIWDNMRMSKQDMDLQAYQLSAEALNRIGLHTGTLVRFHQARRSTQYYKDDLEILQYDMLYGKKYIYGGESPYHRLGITLGVNPVTLDGVKMLSEDSFEVYGTNFTASSKVEINGELIEETTFVSPEILTVHGVKLIGTDMIDVAQQSNSSTKKVLSRTEDHLTAYIEVKDTEE